MPRREAEHSENYATGHQEDWIEELEPRERNIMEFVKDAMNHSREKGNEAYREDEYACDVIPAIVQEPDFHQTFMDHAKANYNDPKDPALDQLISDISHIAVVGDDYDRTDRMISGPWEQEAMNIQYQLHNVVNQVWNSPDGRVPPILPYRAS